MRTGPNFVGAPDTAPAVTYRPRPYKYGNPPRPNAPRPPGRVIDWNSLRAAFNRGRNTINRGIQYYKNADRIVQTVTGRPISKYASDYLNSMNYTGPETDLVLWRPR